MAKKNELAINVKVKGGAQAKRELSDITKEVDRGVNKIGKGGRGGRGGPRGKSAPRAGAGGGGGGGGIGVGGVFVATLLAGMVQKAFSAVTQTLQQSFDPRKSPLEKKALTVQAGLSAVPIFGETAASAFGAATQSKIAAAQGTAGQLENIFGGATRGIGAANPNLTAEQLSAKIEDVLGPQIRRIADIIRPQELGAAEGRIAFAKASGKESDLDIEEGIKDAVKIGKESVELMGRVLVEGAEAALKLTGAQDKFQNASDSFVKTLEDLGVDVEGIRTGLFGSPEARDPAGLGNSGR